MQTSQFIRVSALTLAVLSAPLLAGCEEQGPAEQAGEAIDNAVEQGAEAVEEAGEAAQ